MLLQESYYKNTTVERYYSSIHAFNACAQLNQSLIDSRKAAIDLANVLNSGFALSAKGSDKHGHARANIRAGNHGS